MKTHEELIIDLYTMHTADISWKTILFQLRIYLALDLRKKFLPQIVVVEQD